LLIFDAAGKVVGMKPRTGRPGKTIKCSGGYEAFVPDPLPPQIMWTERLLRSLSDADRLIGQLAREGRGLPNPHLLTRPFVRREAVFSSRIEGTQATLGELLAAEAVAAVARSPDDLREVANYVVALEYGAKRLHTLPLSLRLVKEIHAKLMKGVRGEVATPGEFRRSQNWIGPAGCTFANAAYVPPPPDELMNCLGAWEGFLHDRTLPPLVHAGLVHSQFEAIHPFLDGNGRIGRLLVILLLLERAILPAPLLYLSAFFEAAREEYYDRLRGVVEHAEWEAWLEYFLNGVARMSEDVLGRTERINARLSEWRRAASAASSATPAALVDLLAENPFWTVKKVAERLHVAFTTAQRAVDRLEKMSVLTQVSGAKRDRVYCARRIMDILYEPAHLKPESQP
jgi:Fic family protein